MKKSVKSRAIDAHEKAHNAIENKLSYILNEVSANGNPGLDSSLKDLYQGQKEIKTLLAEIYITIKPDLDKAAFWRAAKEMFRSSPFFKFHSTPVGFSILVIGAILVANALLFPILGVPVVTWATLSTLFTALLHKIGIL